MRAWGRSVLLLAVLSILQPSTTARPQAAELAGIAYHLAMPAPATHLFEVTMTLEIADGPALHELDLQMPRWQPGRYGAGNFAANVQEFQAGAGGRPLRVTKTDDQTWRVFPGENRQVTVTYKVFGNDLSGTYAQLDATHANFNGGEIFMYVVGQKHRPVELNIQTPAGWRAINGSSVTPDQTSWRYPNYELLIDNPTEVGPDWTLEEFAFGGKSYRVVVHSRAPENNLRPALVRDIRRIVDAHVAMWGEPDFDRYTFLYHFAGDNRSYDGMEHLTSTQIIRPGALDAGSLGGVIETTSHEFFHVWNVKRLRPVEFGPWDWTRPANTRSLWFAEGVTEYYGRLMMHRAGIWDASRYFREIAATITEVENTPGNLLMSAVDASLAAAFIDAAVHRQQTNLQNSSISYYAKGEVIGVVLDLAIRVQTKGQRSLDDVMRRMYDEFYVKAPNASYYLRGRGYTEEDFVRVLSAVAGEDMSGFYERHIRGVERLPYESAFAGVGLRLARNPAEGAFSGIVLDSLTAAPRLGFIRTDSPAARAGLQQGDLLLSVGGAVVNRQNWRSALDAYKPGDRVAVDVQRFGKPVRVELQLAPPALFDYRLEEIPNASAEARRLREGWLGR
jgi:predicted metalloprotease with PDZ domain